MSTSANRDSNGRFNGTSGNPNGRPKKQSTRLLTVADLHRITLEVASTNVTAMIDGKPRSITLYQQAIWAMATGKVSGRLALAQFAELTRSAAHGYERCLKKEEERNARRSEAPKT